MRYLGTADGCEERDLSTIYVDHDSSFLSAERNIIWWEYSMLLLRRTGALASGVVWLGRGD